MDGLVQWLRDQLDEDEWTARAAASYDDGAAHDVLGPPGTWTCLNESEWFGPSYRGGVIAPRIGLANAPELGAHIVAHDPARVLREIEAKRQLIARGGPFCTSDCDDPDNEPKNPDTDWTTPLEHHLDCAAYEAAKVLALPCSDRPGYRDEWRP